MDLQTLLTSPAILQNHNPSLPTGFIMLARCDEIKAVNCWTFSGSNFNAEVTHEETENSSEIFLSLFCRFMFKWISREELLVASSTAFVRSLRLSSSHNPRRPLSNGAILKIDFSQAQNII